MPNSQRQAGAAGAKPRDPAEDRRTLEAVVEAARLREHARAAALARAALASGLEHAVLFNVVALELELTGRPAEAAEWLHRAVEIAPRDVSARNALGLCLLQLERPAEALEHFDALAASNPEFPFVHVSRGNALRALGQASQAEESYRRAVAIDAEHPLAWAGLAQISAHRGTYREARFRAQKALAAAPDLP
ncbi:MAG TPA: tetratricopeptide repeat protein, partial [Steroidobacteraceae bacterium]|nr:tetratricopeptide repeat protein [Steroidobacteraceae bacterium]